MTQLPRLDQPVLEGLVAIKQSETPNRLETMRTDMLTGSDAGDAATDLLGFVGQRKFSTVLADPPWRFTNRTGKMAPEHRRLSRYSTMTLEEIKQLPVNSLVADPAYLYLWVPNALLPLGLSVLHAWGFEYKSNIVWHKIRKDAGS